MDNAARTLAMIGVEPEQAAELARRRATPPDGVLDPEDTSEAEGPALAIQLLLLAADDSRRFGDAMSSIIAWLEPQLDALSAYDQARFHHLSGFKAWRLDGVTGKATFELNASIRLLTEDGGARAKRYSGRVHDSSGMHLHQQGILSEARHAFERALQIREETGDHAGEAITLGNLGRLCLEVGSFAEAKDYFERDVALVRARTPERTRTIAQLLSHIARCQLHLGQSNEAEATLEESRSIAHAAGDVVSQLYADIGLGRAALMKQDAKAANAKASAVEARLAEITHAGIRGEVAVGARHLHADSERALGNLDASLGHYEHAIKTLEATPSASAIDFAELLVGKAEVLLALGRIGETADHLRRALRYLDSTAAEAMRSEVDARLKSLSTDAWLLHAAGRFVGQRHIESLLVKAGEAGFRGERRHATVLFSDIRGFTTVSERLPPEDLIVLLNDFLSLMTRCIERHGGMVDKFIGDAVMAIFDGGAAAAEACIDAAIAMRDELERFNRRLPPNLPALAIGIGIHRGDLVAGLIGSPQKREFTVIGDVVNTASRIEGMTKQLGASILVTSAVLDGVKSERFLLRPLGAYSPKGRKEPLRVFDVMALRDRTPATQRMDQEIARVSAALAQFEGRRFRDAAAAFGALGPRYRFLADAAREYAEQDPGAAWNGAITLTSK